MGTNVLGRCTMPPTYRVNGLPTCDYDLVPVLRQELAKDEAATVKAHVPVQHKTA